MATLNFTISLYTSKAQADKNCIAIFSPLKMLSQHFFEKLQNIFKLLSY